ncbi:hypothetical protein [Candidatus Phytoplasma solani]|uniref:hypothetical protein n=1 Tax=Candidatus Phytoplasma solani TaxID=69896 RepID=UPI0003B7BE7B|nr:conserved hypothetical protein [Candidatus Phytoplasma solani]
MKRKQLIKDIIAFLILVFAFVAPLVFIIINDNPSHEKITLHLYLFPSFILLGIYCYITFKITKGKFFIYKDPNKPKALNNLDFGESFPGSCLPVPGLSAITSKSNKFMNYSKDLPSPFFFSISSSFWCYYVKFFQLLGVFTFLEKDFNKTINSHNYFPISVSYYEKQKKI